MLQASSNIITTLSQRKSNVGQYAGYTQASRTFDATLWEAASRRRGALADGLPRRPLGGALAGQQRALSELGGNRLSKTACLTQVFLQVANNVADCGGP